MLWQDLDTDEYSRNERGKEFNTAVHYAVYTYGFSGSDADVPTY